MACETWPVGQFANQCSRCSIFSPDLSEGPFPLFFYLFQNLKAISNYTLPLILLNEGQLAQQAEHQAGGGEGQREDPRGLMSLGGGDACRVED